MEWCIVIQFEAKAISCETKIVFRVQQFMHETVGFWFAKFVGCCLLTMFRMYRVSRESEKERKKNT